MYVCICHAVSEDEVAQHIAAGACSEEAVARATGAGTGCGSCVDRICDMIGSIRPEHGLAHLRQAG